MLSNLRNVILKHRLHNFSLLCVRKHSCDHDQVRVRFAPSPTGYLHLGGLRTALYNYLFAKKYGGTFILRIEDTDDQRLVTGASEQICKDLEWAGLKPNEGPYDYGGKFGPYIQSARLPIYREKVKELIDHEHAYYCFCSERRLELLRKEALRTRQIPKYDNRCRYLTPGQLAEKLAKQDPFCIRFKLSQDVQEFKDLVYGDIRYDVTQNEGDPVIIKSDGFPTYHFANVVDDHLMEITHVLRGVEWQMSTTKHLLMYKAFGWNAPKYAHLPLIMNADGSKLSKRQNDIQVEHYRSNGIFPQALMNYITLSGGGFNNITTTARSESMMSLINKFDISRINQNSGRLNPDLLDECNREEILQQIDDPEKLDNLVKTVKHLVMQAYPDHIKQLDLKDDHVKTILKLFGYRLTSLNQLVEGKFSFVWILPKLNKQLNGDLSPELLELLINELKDGAFTKADLQGLLKKFSKKNNLAFTKMMKSMRYLLSGLEEGPSVVEMMEILGRDRTIQRISRKQ